MDIVAVLNYATIAGIMRSWLKIDTCVCEAVGEQMINYILSTKVILHSNTHLVL